MTDPRMVASADPATDAPRPIPHTSDGPAVVDAEHRPGQALSLHASLLGLALVVFGLALVLRVRDDQQVLLPVIGLPLPELCTFKRTSGLDCPGCGMTRCFISLAHGDLARAWRLNPAGLLLFAMLLFQVPYRSLQLWRVRTGRPEFELHRWGTLALASFGGILLVQWAARIGPQWFAQM